MFAFVTTLLASDPFGKIDSPVGTFGDSPSADLGQLLGVGIGLVIAVAGLAALAYGLWGALNWITAGGDKDKLRTAQGKIRDALLGVLVLVVVFAVFALLMQNVLGGRIIEVDDGIRFKLPVINGESVPQFPN